MKFTHLVTAATVVLSVFASPVAQDATPGTKDLSINTRQDLSASDVCGCLNQVAALSDDLRAQVESLTILNAPFKANGVVTGLQGIVSVVATATVTITAHPGRLFSDDDARLIVVALNNFVKALERLLSAIIGKHEVLLLFTLPIRLVLGSCNAGINAFLTATIRTIPTQATVTAALVAELGNACQDAIKHYS